MSLRTLGICSFVCAVGVACGSSSNGSGGLTCAWLAGSSNCWRSTLDAATSCLPPSGSMGTLSGDLKTCSYATGQVITFSSALTLPLPSMSTLSFTITANGSPCLTWQESSSQDFSATTSAGNVSLSASGGSETISCPNGSSVSASVQQALQDLSCGDAGFGGLPGTVTNSTMEYLAFSLLGAGSNDTLALVDCSTAVGAM